MGDNGLLNGEHGMVDKRTMHEPSIRIPLVVRYPRPDADGPAARSSSSRCSRSTWRRACSNSAAPRRCTNVHGRSWVKLVREGDAAAGATAWFYEYNYEKQFPYTPNVRGVRTDEWKYIHYPHGDGTPDRHLAELYDLKQDPGENVNLVERTGIRCRRAASAGRARVDHGRHGPHAADRQDAD